jgi:hypothetical protein
MKPITRIHFNCVFDQWTCAWGGETFSFSRMEEFSAFSIWRREIFSLLNDRFSVYTKGSMLGHCAASSRCFGGNG